MLNELLRLKVCICASMRLNVFGNRKGILLCFLNVVKEEVIPVSFVYLYIIRVEKRGGEWGRVDKG